MKMVIGFLSDLVPDCVKNNAWHMFDRREFWRCCRWVYKRDFELAYFVLRLHERNLSWVRASEIGA